ncbi:hypothetical protein [Mycoplana ramosa]|uniref:Uncharacterized protein n=1 Tax=Mycoplana ramosa TaxID=40837 RepID=A0ABW3Z1Y6_MYCRA
MSGQTQKLWILVRALCAVALLSVGFAHKPPVLDVPGGIALSNHQYVLPDGSLPDNCLSLGGGQDDGGLILGKDCEACRLSATTALPGPADTLGEQMPRERERRAPIRTQAFFHRLFPPNAPPRGPPSGLLARAAADLTAAVSPSRAGMTV